MSEDKGLLAKVRRLPAGQSAFSIDMSILTLQSIRKDFGIKEILRDASFSVADGEKVGLIGVNGSGKSTLLKMLAGMESIDGGQRLLRSGARVVYLPQQPDVDENNTVLEQIFADSSEQMQLVRQYEDLSHKMARASGDELDALMRRLSSVTERMERADAWGLETKAKIVLSKLGIDDFEVKVGTLSGGYRKRIALATALLSEPDLLLMDEPTNHLDAESVEWLQDYLKDYRGAILLITHDRYFLDRVTNRILEIDRGDLYTYSGNYSYFLEKKAAQEEAIASSQKKLQGVLRRELAWLRRGAKARSTKQKARIDRYHDMKNREFKEVQGNVDIDTPGRRIGKKVIALEGVSKQFGARQLLQDFTFEFSPQDRIGIIGGNGAGKSTLLNIITGRLEPDAGSVEIGSTIHIGYFDQHSDNLLSAAEQQQRAIEYIKDVAAYVTTADGSQISASQMLERFLFNGNQQYTPIHKLSGGEKRRLFLLKVLMSAPNVLILDEPTNDLDVQTLAVLEEYLQDFNGCAIAVSHDRYFLDRTVNRIFALEPGGTVRQYPGNYSVYLDFKTAEEDRAKAEAEAVSEAKPKKVASKPRAKSTSKPKRLSNYQRREYEELEAKIPELEEQKEALEAVLYRNPPSAYDEVQKLSEQLAALTEEIDRSTERWMELAELDA